MSKFDEKNLKPVRVLVNVGSVRPQTIIPVSAYPYEKHWWIWAADKTRDNNGQICEFVEDIPKTEDLVNYSKWTIEALRERALELKIPAFSAGILKRDVIAAINEKEKLLKEQPAEEPKTKDEGAQNED